MVQEADPSIRALEGARHGHMKVVEGHRKGTGRAKGTRGSVAEQALRGGKGEFDPREDQSNSILQASHLRGEHQVFFLAMQLLCLGRSNMRLVYVLLFFQFYVLSRLFSGPE